MSPEPMEVSVLQSQGFEQQWIVSIRIGSTRRQGPVGTQRPFLFPVNQAQNNYACRIDIYRPVASSPLTLCQGTETYSVLFPTVPGGEARTMTVGVRCMGAPAQPTSAPEAGAEGQAPLTSPKSGEGALDGLFNNMERVDDADCSANSMLPADGQNQAAVAAARAYLDKFRLLGCLQEMLGGLLREKPVEPFSFLLAHLQKLSGAAGASSVTSSDPSSVPQAPGSLSGAKSAILRPMGAAAADNKSSGEAFQEAKFGQSLSVSELKFKEASSDRSGRTLLAGDHRGGLVGNTSEIDAKTLRVAARLVIQSARLRGDIRRLRDDEMLLEETCIKQGVDLFSARRVSAAHICDPLVDDEEDYDEMLSPLRRENGRLRCELEEIRASLCELAVQLAKVLQTKASHLSAGGIVPYLPGGKSLAAGRLSAMTQEIAEDMGVTVRRGSAEGLPDARKSRTSSAMKARQSLLEGLEETDSDSELEEDCWKVFSEKNAKKHRKGVSAEAYGAWNNRRAAFVPPSNQKSSQQHKSLIEAFCACPLFAHVSNEVVKSVTWAMPLLKVDEGTCIIKQGEDGDALFVIISGQADVWNDACTPPMCLCTFERGRTFGELAMLYNMPRSLSIYAGTDGCIVAKLTRSVYQNVIVRDQMLCRERREACLANSRYLDTLSSEQIARLADTMERQEYEEGDEIVSQGEMGDEMFIVQSGECVATVRIDQDDVQEHRRYIGGDLFGERGLLLRSARAATVTALTKVEVLCLNRKRFNRLLGPLSLLQQQHYKTDPRKMIADFYRFGDKRGARGCCVNDPNFAPDKIPDEERTKWFAVYRPTSRDAIAKMLSGDAVGKGLNVKGKSAKQGRISGFVPFMQISKNEDKAKLKPPDATARVRIFFHTEHDRELMLGKFVMLLDPHSGVDISGDRIIDYIDLYDNVYGLDIPEPVLREAYITQADITFRIGWETGRKSEPAFMDMNIKGVASHAEPKMVLFQSDLQDPLNPHGLLIAYAERTVKPVVSDFDTFLVGSHGMEYEDLPPEQEKLLVWAIDKTEKILSEPGEGSWTSRWLQVLTESAMHVKLPKYGFGDPVSYQLISEVIDATIETGAIRHGAECFNYVFPQELDDAYLVVWHDFEDGKAWEYLDEDELRDFLIDRAKEGYIFPLNPVWLIRDLDWWCVYEALISSDEGQSFINHYFKNTEHSNVPERLQQLHDEYPDGFLAHGTGIGSMSRKSVMLDMDSAERIGLALLGVVEGTEEDEEEDVIPVTTRCSDVCGTQITQAIANDELGIVGGMDFEEEDPEEDEDPFLKAGGARMSGHKSHNNAHGRQSIKKKMKLKFISGEGRDSIAPAARDSLPQGPQTHDRAALSGTAIKEAIKEMY